MTQPWLKQLQRTIARLEKKYTSQDLFIKMLKWQYWDANNNRSSLDERYPQNGFQVPSPKREWHVINFSVKPGVDIVQGVRDHILREAYKELMSKSTRKKKKESSPQSVLKQAPKSATNLAHQPATAKPVAKQKKIGGLERAPGSR